MKPLPEQDLLRVQQLITALNGVFRLSDLQIALKSRNLPTLHNRINRIVRAGLLKRFRNGIYIAEGFSRETLSIRINPAAYLSLGTVLAANGLIGTAPEKRLYAVKIGRSRRYQHADLTIEHLGISAGIYFGFIERNGIKYADSEKAYLDTLYYHMKGRRFSFNPAADVNTGLLNMARIRRYLARYKNGRFVKFCRGLLDGR